MLSIGLDGITAFVSGWEEDRLIVSQIAPAEIDGQNFTDRAIKF